MKKCECCGTMTTDNSKFCPSCGNMYLTLCTPDGKPKHRKLSSFVKALIFPLVFYAATSLTTSIAAFIITIIGMYQGFTSELELTRFALETYNSLSVYISLATNLLLILGIIIYFIIRKKNVCRELGLRKFPLYVLPLCAILGYSMQYVMGLILTLIPWPESFIQNFEETYAGIDNSGLLITILSVSIVTGFTEELIFRVLPMSRLGKAFGAVFSVMISSLIFGVAHITPIAIFYATLLGVLLGIIYHKYKSIWPCAIVHMFFNMASVIGLPTTSPTFVLAFYFTGISLAVLTGYFILRNPAVE